MEDYGSLVERALSGPYFEDLKPGLRYRNPLGRTVTDVDNIWFTLLTSNVNPIHFDKGYTEKNYPGEPFKGRLVVNGLLTLSIAIGLTTHLSSRGFMLGIENVKFHKPVFSGDTIYAEAEVIEARESKSRPGFGIVKLRIRAYNQNNDLLLECDRTIMVPKKGHRWA
ncbi:MaoC family dehydratase [Desulfurococcaceae archaeon AG1]|nr:MaoC family dehydratase [Desulfurococcaceae archaeon AG1]